MWSTVTTFFASTDARPERDGRDHRPEPDPLGHAPRAPARVAQASSEPAGLAAHDRAVVVGAEEPVEAGVLGRAREREPLLPGDALLALDHQADAHYSGVT